MKKLFKKLNEKLQDRKTSEKVLEININKLDAALAHLKDLEEARSIFQKASQATQIQLSNQISTIVSSALSAVFDDPYKLVVDFVSRRNSTECDLWFERNGKRKKPLDSCGYGAASVASLALRVAYWKLDGEARNVLILDEPLVALSLDKHERASMLVSELSKMPGGLQFIIVTHSKKMASYADKVFRVKKENDVSKVTEVTEKEN
ncbi:MAG: hypothetical protein ACTSWD_11665 [Candidatus Heimdallarchaeota archaeon]